MDQRHTTNKQFEQFELEQKIWGFPKMVQPWVFLLKMIILGWFGGTTIYGNTHILT